MYLSWLSCSRLGEDNTSLGYDGPCLLRDVVLVDVDIIAIGVQIVVEHKRSIHEGAWIDKTSTLFNLHFLHVEDKTSIENMESHCTLSTK